MNRRGITLFESVAAIAVVGIVAASAMSSVGAQLRLAARSSRAVEAQVLATSKLDYLPLMTDGELRSLPDSVAHGTFEYPMDGYRWTLDSEPLNDEPGIFSITLNILWDEDAYQVHTYAYRRPLQVTQ